MKKDLLIVTTRFPWPLTNGFANKNYWLLRGLSDFYNISLFVIQRQRVIEADMVHISPFCRVIKTYSPTFFDVLKGVVNSIFRDFPLQLGLFYCSKARKEIRLCMGEVSIAMSSVIRGYPYIDQFKGPVICDLADSLGQVYYRDCQKFSFFKKLIFREEARRLLKYEKFVIKNSDAVFLFNKKEAEFFSSENVKVLPHGVDERIFNLEFENDSFKNGIVILGKMNFEPNVHAVQWFVENVLHLLDPEIHLFVVGVSPTKALLRLAQRDSRIKVMGYVANPYPMIAGAIACICPVQIGGGIQNKVIEGLAAGALNIVSPLASIPMVNLSKSGLIVCRTPEEWALSINDAKNRPNKFLVNREMGKEYARQHFSWSAYSDEIRKSMENVLKNYSGVL